MLPTNANDMNDSVPKVLYHYTSYQGAKSILAEKQFHMYRSNTMNDPTEVNSGLDIFFELLFDYAEERRKSDGSYSKATMRLGTCYYITVEAFNYYKHHTKENLVRFGIPEDEASRRAFIDRATSKDEEELRRIRAVYTLCFSEKCDVLDLWRPYGDDGQGVCIGVKYETLKEMKIAGKVKDEAKLFPTFLRKVTYDKQELVASIRDILDKMIASIDTEGARNLFDICEEVYHHIICYKDSHYKSENEWRLYFYTKMHFHRPEFNHTKNRPRPYMITPAINKYAFAVVATGPCSKFDGVDDEAWKHYLSVCELDLDEVELKHMDSIPYRRY